MSEEMSSKNSNNSDIEVIGLEDLEDSPPPQDTVEADTGAEEEEAKEASPEVSGAGDQETEAIGEVKETEAKEATPEVKETQEATPAPATDTEDPPVEHGLTHPRGIAIVACSTAAQLPKHVLDTAQQRSERQGRTKQLAL